MKQKIIKIKTALTDIIANTVLQVPEYNGALDAYHLCDKIIIDKFGDIGDIPSSALLKANFLKHGRVLKKLKNKKLVKVGEVFEKMGKQR